MKAFRKNLSDFVHKGLRTTPELGRRKGDLALCYNFIVDAGGLTPYEAINNKFSARLLSVWPFPQVYYGIQNSFIFDEDAIYDIDGETELASVPNGGSRWDIVDYFGYVILCNSNYCLYRDAVSGDIASITASDSIPTFKTACDFRGQLFIGNITSEWNDCGESHVAWSQIGNADFSLTKRNEANFTRLPFDGEVLKLKTLSDGVIAYAENGIMSLIPLPNSPHVGMRLILNQGVLSRNAIAGDGEIHLFVDKNYRLWKMSRDLVPKRIGYKEFLEPLGSDICITYDKVLKRFYISNGVKSYCVTAFAMTEVFQSPTFVENGEGYVYDSGERRAFIETSELDFALPGLKSVETISVGTTDKYVSVGARSFDTDICVDTVTDRTGSGFPRNTGSVLSIRVIFDNYKNANIQSLFVEGKHIDKRFTRGYDYDKKA